MGGLCSALACAASLTSVSFVFASQSKDAGIRTLVMLDEQGGECSYMLVTVTFGPTAAQEGFFSRTQLSHEG